jgi:anti-sigma B factor antagonist
MGRKHLPVVRVGSWAMVSLPAEVDMETAPDVAAGLGVVVGDGAAVVVVDMSATAFCDTSGVQVLLAAHRQTQHAGAQLRVVAPSPTVRRVLELLEVDRVLAVYATLAEALIDAPRHAGADGHEPGRPRPRDLAAGPDQRDAGLRGLA